MLRILSVLIVMALMLMPMLCDAGALIPHRWSNGRWNHPNSPPNFTADRDVRQLHFSVNTNAWNPPAWIDMKIPLQGGSNLQVWYHCGHWERYSVVRWNANYGYSLSMNDLKAVACLRGGFDGTLHIRVDLGIALKDRGQPVEIDAYQRSGDIRYSFPARSQKVYDIDRNGTIGVADVVELLKLIQRGNREAKYDYNNDGRINNLDVNLLRAHRNFNAYALAPSKPKYKKFGVWAALRR